MSLNDTHLRYPHSAPEPGDPRTFCEAARKKNFARVPRSIVGARSLAPITCDSCRRYAWSRPQLVNRLVAQEEAETAAAGTD
jgi:hypothetical protein